MDIGRKNIIAGGVAIFVCAIAGFCLGSSLEPFYEDGFYKLTYARSLVKAFHTHGMPFALYNIIIGAIVDKLVLSDGCKKRLSIFSLFAYLMPIGLLLRGLNEGATIYTPVVMIGAVAFLLSAFVMIRGAIKKSV